MEKHSILVIGIVVLPSGRKVCICAGDSAIAPESRQRVRDFLIPNLGCGASRASHRVRFS